MLTKTKSYIKNLFNPEEAEKETQEQKTATLQNKTNTVLGATTNTFNPFLDKNGNLFNKYIDYQSLLDSDNVSSKAKEYITSATGLTQRQNMTTAPSTVPASLQSNQSSSYDSLVGKRITDTSKFKNNASLGQCVWYVRGRASEKMGVDPGSLGNAKDVWYNAPSDKKVSATADNLKPNMIVSYASGPGTAAQYGHVIYIEDVVGDTVYYTEGGSTYYKKGTDGVVKTASRQGILNGKNNDGATIGANVVGFIDLNKY